MMLGMGSQPTVLIEQPLLPIPAVTAVAAGPPPALTWAELDQMIGMVTAYVTPATVAASSNEDISQYCQACADPKRVLVNKLGNSPLSPGMTFDSILSRYSSQLNSVCGLYLAEAKRRNLPCAYAPSGFSIGSIPSGVLIGGALIAAALLFGGRD